MSRILKDAIVVGSKLIGGRAIMNAVVKNEKNTTNGRSFINTIGGVVSSAPSYVRYVTDSITQSKINKHNNVINKWVGNRYKEPSLTTYECVAWTKLYAKETFGVTLGRYGDAFGGWLNKYNTFGSKWTKVTYKPGMIPPAGAILFWGPVPSNGNYGHVAIADTGSTSGMLRIVEQNGTNGRNGLGPDAIRRIAIQHSQRGPFVGWYTYEGWGNVHSDFVGVGPENPNDSLSGSPTTFTPGNSLVISGPDQKIIDFLNTLLGVATKKNSGKVSKFGESLRKYTTGNEDLGENGKLLTENINGIMITLMIDLLRRMVGLPTLQDQLNGTNNNGQNQYNQNNIPSPTSSDIYNKLTGKTGTLGDLRNLASQYPNQAWAKNNNPAGLTWNNAFEKPENYPTRTAGLIHSAGITFFKGTARPAREGNFYVGFHTMDDGLVAQRIALQKSMPDVTVRERLELWVGTAERQAYATQVLGFTGIGDTIESKLMKDLTEDEMNKLQIAVIRKESGGLYKILTK